MQDEMQKGVQTFQTAIDKVIEFFVTYSFEVLGALIVLLLGYMLSRWAARVTLGCLERKRVDQIMARFAAGAVRGLILGFAIIVALGKFGVTIAPIVAGIGALIFGGTFALQGVLSNMAGGFSLLIFRPFVVGDTITVTEVSGVVEEVKLGCTILTNEDGEKITIPNRHIVGEVLRNSFGHQVVEAAVGISYGDDPERAIAAVKAALQQVAEVGKTPPPIVGIREFGDSAITIGLRYWVPTKQYVQVSYAVNLAIHKALKAAGITIPFPQRDVRIVSQP